MKKATKKNCVLLFEHFASGNDCKADEKRMTELYESVEIGDMLQVMQGEDVISELTMKFGFDTNHGEILCGEYLNILWGELKFTDSLNQIFDKYGFKEYEYELIIDNDDARILFEFLINVLNICDED